MEEGGDSKESREGGAGQGNPPEKRAKARGRGETVKWICFGLAAIVSVLWGVYAEDILKSHHIDEYLETPCSAVWIFSICIGIGVLGSALKEWRYPLCHWLNLFWSPLILLIAVALTLGFRWQLMSTGLWCFAALGVIGAIVASFRSKPAYEPREDKLGRGLLYKTFCRELRKQVNSADMENKGLSIAVRGPWGSGKSHFINDLAAALDTEIPDAGTGHEAGALHRRPFIISSVDLWQSATVADMWNDIAAELSGMVSNCDVSVGNKARKALYSVLEAVNISPSLAELAVQFLSSGADMCGKFERLISRFRISDRRFMLILDNLDRCSRRKQEALFPLIERLTSIPNLVVVCGIAMEEMAGGTQNKNQRYLAETFLKVFDIEIPMPLASRKTAREFVKTLIVKYEMQNTHLEKWIEKVDRNYGFSGVSPRVIEKTVLQLAIIDNMYLRHIKGADGGFLEEDSAPGLVESVFTIEALRIINPKVSLPYGVDTDTESYHAWKESLHEAFEESKLLPQFIVQNINRIKEAKEETLDFIAEQRYLRLTILSDKDCKATINKCETGKMAIRDALVDLFKDLYAPFELGSLCLQVVNYALSHPRETQIHWLIQSQYEKTIKGTNDEFTFIMNLISYPFADERKFMEKDDAWNDLVEQCVGQSDLQTLHLVCDLILRCMVDPDARRENHKGDTDWLPQVQAMLYAVNEANRKGIDESAKKAKYLANLNRTLLRKYGYRVAESVMSDETYDDARIWNTPNLWIVGQCNKSSDYVDPLVEGAREYYRLNRESIEGNYREKVCARFLNLLKDEYRTRPDEPYDSAFLFLSFACVWRELAGSVFKGASRTQLKDKVEELITLIDETLARVTDVVSRTKEKRQTNNLVNNAKEAAHIFKQILQNL